MSLTIDDKTLRNLEEQVLKNKEDIAKHYEIDRVLADWGIKVIGVVATINDIPEGNYEYGDSYGLSSTSPMQYVIWTRANPNVGEDTDYWLNVGALSLVGPQGAQGIQGIQGIQGVRGSKWTSSTYAPTATSGYNMGDQWLNTTTGDIYEFRGNTWARLGNIKGPQGVQGPIGPKGDQGIQGPTGSQGPKGDTGSSFTIAGLLNNAENLPTPTEANRHKGYAVKNADNVTYDLYVVVGEAGSLQWVNMGRVEGVEGPQGPVGPQGPAGADIQIVHITGIPSTATQGNLTQDQVNTLLAHPVNYIQFFNENFYPQDVEIGEGYIVYSHVGQIGSETKIKNINLTIATGGWVLTETSLVSAPITIVDTLPEANEENFEKGKIYTTGELLKYIHKVKLDTPTQNIIGQLTQTLTNSSAQSVGDYIYIFGGIYGGVTTSNILRYNTKTQNLETINNMPVALSSVATEKVGDYIYIFGGSNSSNTQVKTIYKYSISNNSITLLNATLAKSYTVNVAYSRGYIYIFNNYDTGAYFDSNIIYRFNIENETVSQYDTVLPYSRMIAGIPISYNEDIYVFGGQYFSGASKPYTNKVYKLSTLTNVFTEVGIFAGNSQRSYVGVRANSNVYILYAAADGSDDARRFYLYNLETNTYTRYDKDLSELDYGDKWTNMTCAAIGDNVYCFGGTLNDSVSDIIVKISIGFTFQYKTIATQ